MESELERFLAERITHHATQYTHQSVYAKKKYNIQDDDREKFWTLYMNHVENDGFISLCERPRPGGYTTIRGDIDIKIPESVAPSFLAGTHFYHNGEILALVEMYMDVLRRYVANLSPSQLICCILEKSSPSVSDGYVKSGFHIEFPFLLCSRDEQRAFLYPKLEQVYTESGFFTRFHDYPQHIFDTKAVTSNPWLVYGSRKGMNKEAYRLSMIVNDQLEEISLTDMMNAHSIWNQSNEPIVVDDPERWEYMLPRILSTVEAGKKKYLRELKGCDYSITTKSLPVLPAIDKEQEKLIPTNPSEALRDVRLLLPMLSDQRATDYKSWFEVGCILYNVGVGSMDALDTWIEFSKRTLSGNFSEATCVSRWNKMARTTYGVGTIVYYAKMDNPEAYQQFKQMNSRKSLMESLRKNGTLTSYSCAEALYHKYKNEFVYAGTGKDGWYKFDHHRWMQIAEGIELRKLIPTLREPIMEEIKSIRDKITRAQNEQRDREEANEDGNTEGKQIKELDKQRGILLKEKNKLEDTPFKDKIMKECKDLFLDQEFMNKINTHHNLTGFTNGVLDVETLEFREGRPTDFITLSTDYEYRDVSDNADEMRQIDDYLHRVFVDADVRHYFLDQACAVLKGGNITKKVVVWSGVGDNSKSVLVTLMRKTFGRYFYEFPTSLLTGKRTQSSSASPELSNSKGTRFAVIQEPSEKEEFNIGTLKELSGNDTMYSRALFKDPTSFLPQFKLTIICNKLPRIPSDDQATWNRIRVVDFKSKFIDESECPSTFEEQLRERKFPIDRSFVFSDKMVQAFMSKLFRRYREIQKRGFVVHEPEQVTEATKKYRVKNDIFMNFLTDKIKSDPETHLTIADMYGAFKDWHKTSYTNACTATRNEFKDYMEKYYKQRFVVNRVDGIRYITEEDHH
jgi:P4 family phage/plasmid primase-like protien